MAKKSLLDDFFTKIVKIFPKDAYLLYNKYVIGGEESEKRNKGYYLVIISEDVNKSLKDLFDNDKVVYISDTRKCKTNISEYTEINENPNKEAEKLSHLLSNIKKVEKWESIEMSDEDIDTLYKKAGTIELFKDNDELPTVIISKGLFPLITEKNINEVYYSVNERDDDGTIMNELILSFTTELLELNMIFLYFSL